MYQPIVELGNMDSADRWEPRFCPTVWCEVNILFVQRCSDHGDLWRVAVDTNANAFLVAATTPICPLCGGHLLTTADYENGIR